MSVALDFLGGEPPKLWTGIIRLNTLPVMRESFTAQMVKKRK